MSLTNTAGAAPFVEAKTAASVLSGETVIFNLTRGIAVNNALTASFNCASKVRSQIAILISSWKIVSSTAGTLAIEGYRNGITLA